MVQNAKQPAANLCPHPNEDCPTDQQLIDLVLGRLTAGVEDNFPPCDLCTSRREHLSAHDDTLLDATSDVTDTKTVSSPDEIETAEKKL